MIRVIRFLLVTVLAANVVSLIGLVFSDFDRPPEEDPHDLLRALGVWAVAILVAVLVELRLRRKQKARPADDATPTRPC